MAVARYNLWHSGLEELTMTEIHQIDLTKQSLTAMPGAERKLLLLLGHATNEINVFQKLVLMSGQEVTRRDS